MTRLDVISIIDAVTGGGKIAGAGASTGTYLALAALNRVVAPRSKLGFALRGDPAGWPPGGLTRFPDDTRCRCLIGSVGRWVTSSMASLYQK